MEVLSRKMTRKELAEFLPTLRAIAAFENVQDDIVTQGGAIGTASFITLALDAELGSERVLTASADITFTDGGAGGDVTLELTDTGVTADTYGGATKTIAIELDAKGRVVAATEYTLDTTNVVEGTNLYFTTARARQSLSSGSGIDYDDGTGVISTTGFTGTGSYTNFTIVDGIITAAS